MSVEDFDKTQFKIYPNPASQEFIISSSNQITRVDVFNTVGKLMSSSTSTSNFQMVDVSDWDLGVYFVKVELVEGGGDTFKIVIE